MTQPAKVQEPSMEEILASIRRIIADDEAKPPAAEKPASAAAPPKPEKPAAAAPVAKAPAMKDIPPSAIPAARAAVAKAAPPPVKPAPPPAAPPPAPAASNSQDDIDALLNGLDEATTAEEIRPPLPDAEVFELTDEMAVPEPAQPPFQRVELQDDTNSREHRCQAVPIGSPKVEPPPLKAIRRLSRSCRARPCRRSNPRSIRWPIPCSATMRGRWKIWSRKCCGRC